MNVRYNVPKEEVDVEGGVIVVTEKYDAMENYKVITLTNVFNIELKHNFFMSGRNFRNLLANFNDSELLRLNNLSKEGPLKFKRPTRNVLELVSPKGDVFRYDARLFPARQPRKVFAMQVKPRAKAVLYSLHGRHIACYHLDLYTEGDSLPTVAVARYLLRNGLGITYESIGDARRQTYAFTLVDDVITFTPTTPRKA